MSVSGVRTFSAYRMKTLSMIGERKAPRAQGAERAREGRGIAEAHAARGSPHWRGLAAGGRLGSLAPGPELLFLTRNRTVPGDSKGLPSVPSPAALTQLVSTLSENRGF